MRLSRWLALIATLTLTLDTVSAADWIHWRGPEQNGVSKETLPESFDLAKVGEGNLLWKTPVGGRSSPLVMGDRMFTINAYDPNLLTEGERITCFDANTGKVLWEYKVNVYHAEVVTSRLGWTTLTADPSTGYIYAHTTAGALICLDKDGKHIWTRHLSEEFGRFTGYGGRIVSPIFDSGLVICAIVNSSWGDQARGGNRFIAFDAKTGQVVWISEPGKTNKGTYQSTPVIAVINGQRLLVAGASDGGIHGMKVRTGEVVWSHVFSSGPINPSPVVVGNLVYSAHGEENPEGGAIGRVVCVDASMIKDGKPKLVWEYRRANRFGLSHPAVADGRMYIPDDGGELFCFDAKKGNLLWKYKYGTTARGAPLIVGKRLFIFDVNAKLVVLHLNGNKEPDEDKTEEFAFRVPAGMPGFCETHCTPIAVNGRLYFTTQFDTYCIGDPKAAVKPAVYDPLPAETPFNETAEPVALQIFPYDMNVLPGSEVKLQLKYLDNNGRPVNAPAGAAVQWSLPTPPIPMGAAAGPPPLKGMIQGNGSGAAIVLEKMPAQQGYVEAKFGNLVAKGRVRVVPQIPYSQDFEKIPEGAPPSGWVNTAGKFLTKKMPDGNMVLSKVNTIGAIPVARANGYITATDAKDYTIQSDLYATEMDGRMPDMGVVNCRYSFVMDGKTDPVLKSRTVRIVSWEARPRVNKVHSLEWKKDTWYTAKLTVTQTEKTALVKAKVWEKGQPEPAASTVEFEDPSPNREGAAALYGYVSGITDRPGANIFYDNVKITPNGAAPAPAPAVAPANAPTSIPAPKSIPTPGSK
jgi:outer membrane protein assembly factor BamB